MRLQHGRRVVFRIEAHGQQARAGGEIFVLDERLRFGELAIHRRTKRRDRALRIDERDGQGSVAADLVKATRPALLIDEGLIGDPISRLQIVNPRGPRRGGSRHVGLRAADFGDFVITAWLPSTLSSLVMRSPGPIVSSMFADCTFQGIVIAAI